LRNRQIHVIDGGDEQQESGHQRKNGEVRPVGLRRIKCFRRAQVDVTQIFDEVSNAGAGFRVFWPFRRRDPLQLRPEGTAAGRVPE
jgi:hypothetical protein